MNDTEKLVKAIKVYRANYTSNVGPPVCDKCNEEATIYDQCAGENYCEKCLDVSLKEDPEQLFSLVSKFAEMEE